MLHNQNAYLNLTKFFTLNESSALKLNWNDNKGLTHMVSDSDKNRFQVRQCLHPEAALKACTLSQYRLKLGAKRAVCNSSTKNISAFFEKELHASP